VHPRLPSQLHRSGIAAVLLLPCFHLLELVNIPGANAGCARRPFRSRQRQSGHFRHCLWRYLRQILFLLKTAPFASPFRDCFVSHSVGIIDGHHRMSESVLKNNYQYKKTTYSLKLFQFALMKVAWQPIHSI
jgi:hypothetical protein